MLFDFFSYPNAIYFFRMNSNSSLIMARVKGTKPTTIKADKGEAKKPVKAATEPTKAPEPKGIIDPAVPPIDWEFKSEWDDKNGVHHVMYVSYDDWRKIEELVEAEEEYDAPSED